MVYKWNGYNYPVKAEVVGREFELIEKEEGELSPESIVERATDKSSALHPLFEWNDKIAAHTYRIEQARIIVHNLVIIEEKPEVEEIVYRAFVNVNEPGKKGRFINIKDAIESEESREVLLRTAISELISFKRKYQKLAELTKVFISIDEIVREMNYEEALAFIKV